MIEIDKKQLKRLEQEVNMLCNRARSKFSFKKIKTYRELLGIFNYPESYGPAELLDKPLDVEMLNSFIDDQQARLAITVDLWQVGKMRVGEYLPLRYDAIDHFEGTPEPSDNKVDESVYQEDTTIDDDEQEKPDDEMMRLMFRVDSGKVDLFAKQFRAAHEIWTNFKEKQHPADLLIAGTGVGKTYIYGAFLYKLKKEGFFQNHTSPWPIIVVTKSSAVRQTEGVLEKLFDLNKDERNVHVINVEQLRAKFGKMFIKEEVQVIDGQELTSFVWKPIAAPSIIIWDECQVLKNTDTTQSKIAQGYSDLDRKLLLHDEFGRYQLFTSATPFIKVSEAKCVVVATKLKYQMGIGGLVEIDNQNWPDFARQVAHPAKPTDKVEAAIERLMKAISEYVIDVKGVRPQFKAINKIKMINFSTAEEKAEYLAAWDEYQKQKERIEREREESGEKGTSMALLAQFTIFRKKAESIRAEYTGQQMYNAVQEGYAAFAACAFKETIYRACKYLYEKHQVPRSKISIIWGGIGKMSKKKRKSLDAMSNKEFQALLLEQDLDLKEFGLDLEGKTRQAAMEDDPFVKFFDLGPQNPAQREQERLKFQSGKADYCFYTFKAGGVGLSIHHCDDETTQKVKRKKNGYAVVESIPSIPTKPRRGFITPVYSAIELVQGLGRAPRLTSLSNTLQEMVFYAGTIEEDVAHTVGQSLRCLRKVVRQNESWEDMIVGAKQVMKESSAIPNDDGEIIETEDNAYELGADVEAIEEDEEN